MIRSVDYGEDHRILSFLTRGRGRLDAIALGAKKSLKRFGPALDFLNHLKIEFQSGAKSGLRRLTQVELIRTHPAIRSDYDRTWTALEWFKLLNQALREEGAVPGLFEVLEHHLEILGAHCSGLADQAFRFHVLRTLGYSLELTRCNRCHARPAQVATFVPADGGLLCASCHAPQASEIRAHFFPAQMFSEPWWESLADQRFKENNAGGEREKILAEAMAYFLAIHPAGADRQRRRGKLPGITLMDSG